MRFPREESGIIWSVLEDESELSAWEAAWNDNDANVTPDPRLWIPTIFHDPDVTFLVGRMDGEIVAVGIADRTGDVIGLSNVFARSTTDIAIWPGIIAKTAELFPDMPIVGYERGDDLTDALYHGFEAIGDLSVWIVE